MRHRTLTLYAAAMLGAGATGCEQILGIPVEDFVGPDAQASASGSGPASGSGGGQASGSGQGGGGAGKMCTHVGKNNCAPPSIEDPGIMGVLIIDVLDSGFSPQCILVAEGIQIRFDFKDMTPMAHTVAGGTVDGGGNFMPDADTPIMTDQMVTFTFPVSMASACDIPFTDKQNLLNPDFRGAIYINK